MVSCASRPIVLTQGESNLIPFPPHNCNHYVIAYCFTVHNSFFFICVSYILSCGNTSRCTSPISLGSYVSTKDMCMIHDPFKWKKFRAALITEMKDLLGGFHVREQMPCICIQRTQEALKYWTPWQQYGQ